MAANGKCTKKAKAKASASARASALRIAQHCDIIEFLNLNSAIAFSTTCQEYASLKFTLTTLVMSGRIGVRDKKAAAYAAAAFISKCTRLTNFTVGDKRMTKSLDSADLGRIAHCDAILVAAFLPKCQ